MTFRRRDHVRERAEKQRNEDAKKQNSKSGYYKTAAAFPAARCRIGWMCGPEHFSSSFGSATVRIISRHFRRSRFVDLLRIAALAYVSTTGPTTMMALCLFLFVGLFVPLKRTRKKRAVDLYTSFIRFAASSSPIKALPPRSWSRNERRGVRGRREMTKKQKKKKKMEMI